MLFAHEIFDVVVWGNLFPRVRINSNLHLKFNSGVSINDIKHHNKICILDYGVFFDQ